MDELFSGPQDAATPLNSAGAPTQPYRNAAGEFNLKKELRRKVLSRKDLDQPAEEGDEPMCDGTDPKYGEGPMATGGTQTDNASDRYFGAFSIEAKRHVWDLLKQHPEFGDKRLLRLNRVGNNTKEVLLNDPTKTVENGGHILYQDQPQASQKHYG